MYLCILVYRDTHTDTHTPHTVTKGDRHTQIYIFTHTTHSLQTHIVGSSVGVSVRERKELPCTHNAASIHCKLWPFHGDRTGLMILIIIIISNITCSKSKQDPDVFGECGCFSEFYIQQLYFNPKDIFGNPEPQLSAFNFSIFGEADDSSASPVSPGLRHLPI